MSPLLSVIVPVYNVEPYVERCARSLFSQSFKDIEFIFVDDCTQDNSIRIIAEVLKDYPSRQSQVRIIHHKKNQGLTSARNTGLHNANGKYIAHCDSDDWVEFGMYERLVCAAESRNLDIVYCDIMMHYVNNEKEVYNATPFNENKVELMRGYISSVWTSVVNMVVRKEIYDINGLESPKHISYCEDYWLSVRLFYYARRIEKVAYPFYNYNRTNETSILHKLNEKSEQEERMANLETIDFFKKEGCFSLYDKELSWRLLKSTHDSIYHSGRYNEFITIFPEAHKYIWSCPYVNLKSKILMWMFANNMKQIALLVLRIRGLLSR